MRTKIIDPPVYGPERERLARARLTRRRLLTRGLGLLAIAVGIDGCGYEPYHMPFERVNVPIRGLPTPFEGYRIALYSDLHYPLYSTAGWIRHAVDMGNAFHPDLIAIPGDFVDRHLSGPVPSFAGLYDAAHAPDGVVATLGNHDHMKDAEGVRRRIRDTTPIQMVENRSFLVHRGGQALCIGGVDDFWEGVIRPDLAFRHVPPDVPRILLSHNPDLAEAMSLEIRVDLQLSGHTHGGAACFPNGYSPFVPSMYGNKFRAGLVSGRHHRVYVTRGVCSYFHARIFCPPEVTGITLVRA